MVSVVCEVWTQVTKKHVQPDSHPLCLRKRLRSVKRTVTLWHEQECTAVTKRRPHSRHHRALGCRPRCVHRRHSQVQTGDARCGARGLGQCTLSVPELVQRRERGPKGSPGASGSKGNGLQAKWKIYAAGNQVCLGPESCLLGESSQASAPPVALSTEGRMEGREPLSTEVAGGDLPRGLFWGEGQ